MATRSFLLLGSNQGNASQHLTEAREAIRKMATIRQVSSIYTTSAWGKTDQPDFLNQVIEIYYNGTATLLLGTILGIEKDMGRIRTVKWGERIIDIDILFYGNQIVEEPDLQIPHPQIPNRRFTLVPMAEIAADYIHPVLQQSIGQLLANCTDLLTVKKLPL